MSSFKAFILFEFVPAGISAHVPKESHSTGETAKLMHCRKHTSTAFQHEKDASFLPIYTSRDRPIFP